MLLPHARRARAAALEGGIDGLVTLIGPPVAPSE